MADTTRMTQTQIIRQLGEKTGQIYYERMVLGNDWQPLQPTSVERSGNVITVNFHVPVPPLACVVAVIGLRRMNPPRGNGIIVTQRPKGLHLCGVSPLSSSWCFRWC